MHKCCIFFLSKAITFAFPTHIYTTHRVDLTANVTLAVDGWWSVMAADWGEFGEAARNGWQLSSSGHIQGVGEKPPLPYIDFRFYLHLKIKF